MATFKSTFRSKREDGTYLVYIRCTHNRQVAYIKTDMYITEKKIKKGEIADPDINGRCSINIMNWQAMLNKENISNWSVQDVIKFIQQGNTGISFIPYCELYIADMINKGRERTAKNYQTALNAFIIHFGSKISFQEITSKELTKWILTLMDKPRAKEMYPVCIRAMFDAGCLEYNDYDRNIIRIQNQPFKTVKIPKADVPKKRAESADIIRKLLMVTPDTKRSEMAQDVAKLIIYLVGINTVDLFYMDKSCYDGQKIKYNRRKTEGERSDKAYMEVAVDDEIKPLFEKYKGENVLFNWGYSDSQSFNKYVNMGLKRLCEIAVVEKVTTYTFRHSWATIAQNKCGASTELVAFCLNHSSAHKVTEGYIEKDFKPIDKMNKKVLDYIFQRGEYEIKKEAD